MTLQEMKQNQKAELNAAEAMVNTAQAANRDFTASENARYEEHLSEARSWGAQARKIEMKNTISLCMNANGVPKWLHDESAFTGARAGAPVPFPILAAETHNPAYASALHAFISTGGKSHGDELTAGADGNGGYYIPGSETYTQQRKPNGQFARTGVQAATYEGNGDGSSGAAGGYAINVQTEQVIAELQLPDLGLYDASMVIPTANNLKVPVQASFGTSAIKAESTGTVATFGGTDPALGQVELGAYMIGALRLASWELLQDVSTFQSFIVNDLLKGQRILEGQLFATGNGTTQPQGLFGNTGTGTGTAYQLAGTAADAQTLLNALFDVTATLKGYYQANASWVMSRATGLAIRRAQMQANLFAPVATVDADGTERILGRPVFYDVNAPALPTATTAGVLPILFGDFKAGNLIGVRGGAGINVKILDQPWAQQGQLGILAYRRVDSRVRLTEAIQSVKVSHS